MHKTMFCELFWLSGCNYNYINNRREKLFSDVPLFPTGQTINYSYINNVSENYFCCQVTITITGIIPLRIIHVIILWTMVLLNNFDSFSTPFWTFRAYGLRGPGNSISDSIFAVLGAKGPNDPCSGQKFPKAKLFYLRFHV